MVWYLGKQALAGCQRPRTFVVSHADNLDPRIAEFPSTATDLGCISATRYISKCCKASTRNSNSTGFSQLRPQPTCLASHRPSLGPPIHTRTTGGIWPSVERTRSHFVQLSTNSLSYELSNFCHQMSFSYTGSSFARPSLTITLCTGTWGCDCSIFAICCDRLLYAA